MYDKIQVSIKSFANEIVKKEIHRYGIAGRQAIKEIHNNIIDEWFGEYNSTSMKRSIVTDYKSRLYDDGTGKIYVHAFADSSMYNQEQEIQKWNKRNNIGMSHDLLVEYVMSLQLFEGIIGLPADGMREVTNRVTNGHLDENNRWVNDNFIQKTPLITFIKDSPKWNEWEKTVNKYL